MVLIDKIISDPLKNLEVKNETICKIIGVGRFGINVLNYLSNQDIKNVEYIPLTTKIVSVYRKKMNKKYDLSYQNTSILEKSEQSNKILNGVISYLDNFIPSINTGDVLIFITDLSEQLSSDVITAISEISLLKKALLIGIVKIPFKHELLKYNEAIKNINLIRKITNTTIILNDNNFLEAFPQLPFELITQINNENICNIVSEIIKIFNQQTMMNFDKTDLYDFFMNGGWSVVGVSKSQTPNRVEDAATNALHNTMLISGYKQVKGALIEITGGRDFTLDEAVEASEKITKKLEKNSMILWDSKINSSVTNYLKVVIFLTGLDTPFGHDELKFSSDLYEMEPNVNPETKTEVQLNLQNIEFIN
ncbi:hypothetical protein FJY84_07415 [Candidatus Bathyarchaeota archaeon]|nr:hypothetical protein [Candidatus Bathyarchaeota archaeon]